MKPRDPPLHNRQQLPSLLAPKNADSAVFSESGMSAHPSPARRE